MKKMALMIVHNRDRFHQQHYATGKPLSLSRLQPVAMIVADSIYQATAIACSGDRWQSDASITVRLGDCKRVSALGDLVFDSADRIYYLITGKELLPMKLQGNFLFASSLL